MSGSPSSYSATRNRAEKFILQFTFQYFDNANMSCGVFVWTVAFWSFFSFWYLNKNCFKSEFGLKFFVKKNYQSTRRVQQIFRRLNTVLSTASILFDIFFDERICNFLQPVSSLWFFCPRVSCTAGRCTSPRKGLLLQVRPEIWSCFNNSKSCFLLNFAF